MNGPLLTSDVSSLMDCYGYSHSYERKETREVNREAEIRRVPGIPLDFLLLVNGL